MMKKEVAYDLEQQVCIPVADRFNGNPTVFIDDQKEIHCSGRDVKNYINISCEYAKVGGVDVPIKLHYERVLPPRGLKWRTEKRVAYLRQGSRTSNVILSRGTRLVAREKINWGDLGKNDLYLESPATRFVNRGLLIELQYDVRLFKPDPEFDFYQCVDFEQLDALYQLAVPYEPTEIPELGSNHFLYAVNNSDGYDLGFDQRYFMFILSHASQEQLHSTAYIGPLRSFGIVLE